MLFDAQFVVSGLARFLKTIVIIYGRRRPEIDSICSTLLALGRLTTSSNTVSAWALAGTKSLRHCDRDLQACCAPAHAVAFMGIIINAFGNGAGMGSGFERP